MQSALAEQRRPRFTPCLPLAGGGAVGGGAAGDQEVHGADKHPGKPKVRSSMRRNGRATLDAGGNGRLRGARAGNLEPCRFLPRVLHQLIPPTLDACGAGRLQRRSRRRRPSSLHSFLQGLRSSSACWQA